MSFSSLQSVLALVIARMSDKITEPEEDYKLCRLYSTEEI